ncbi:glycosyltransferase family A protein [Nostoc sp. C117]|uniref:glycosyltransferase family A protein n=1 Tax=Nostoc sp. C117 TaxID=3349875 RepID=UPI00370DAF24
MLVFLIPIKSPKIATSWTELSKMFERCLRSVCNQTSSKFQVIVICHEIPDINFHHPQVKYIKVDFPIPGSTLSEKMVDKRKKLAVGLLAARELKPTHIMPVDADDCISKRIASYVAENPESNGWYIDIGYEYEEGSSKIIVHKKQFYRLCGTSNIINYRLFSLPEKVVGDEPLTGHDDFLEGHPLAKRYLAAQGTPLEPLPFPGAIYIKDKIREGTCMQESLFTTLKRNPKQALRGIKKTVLAPFIQRKLTDEIRAELNLYPLSKYSQRKKVII